MTKKPLKSRKLNVYSNLSLPRKTKKDLNARKRAQYLASLPKNPIERFFYHMQPKRLAEYWFSKEGAITALKIAGISIAVICLMIGGLFIYFRKDLDAIRPGELAKRVQTTVTKYLDRNGNLLWEDKGNGSYKLVVNDNEISEYVKEATIAIEDKEFYTHGGVSIPGLVRAAFNNVYGGDTQGGSTLTQQLVKQVFFADEAQQRGLAGIPRKIKEVILSIEVERMYNKGQILNLYLNESPYGGRRNGVESASQTYFGKTAKKLTVAEAALLAAIPQNPALYNPYNVYGHKALIARQNTVINGMLSQGYITKAQAEEAKKYPILDHIIPEANQYAGIKAPHFVQMVRSELEGQLGKATVGKGGLTVKTTLDLRIQNKLVEAMDDMFNSSTPARIGFTNGASTVEDVKTGQIVALMGSRDFNMPGYGQDNATVSYIQPGSSIKPLVYSTLFQKKPAGQLNYGSGSILKDENIDAIYGAHVANADGKYNGNITIRSALANSRNIPAIKAMYISGVKTTLDNMRKMGATSYCTQGSEKQVGLAAAIGGCGIKQIDLTNAYATIARQGAYKKQSTILEVKNNSGEVLKKWTDSAPVQIIDPQSTYIVSDILSDDVARAPLNGRHAKGFEIPGVKTSTKTGTSDKGGYARDIWIMSYSPNLVMSLWFGNSDASILRVGISSTGGPVIGKVMEYAHKEVYAAQNLWKSGDWFTKPVGIQVVGGELYPAWWNNSQGKTNAKLTFDRVSKKKATNLTPAGARIELDVTKMIDPVTKKEVYIAPDGYDANSDDDAHKAGDVAPTVSVNVVQPSGSDSYSVNVIVQPGTYNAISNVLVTVGGATVVNTAGTSSNTYTYSGKASSSPLAVTATATDSAYYTGSSSATVAAYSGSP